MEENQSSMGHEEARIKRKMLDELEETYHGQERRKQKQGSGFISTIDRWGPGVIALLTLIAFIGYSWITDQRIARLEGSLDTRIELEIALRSEIQTWQAYIISLQKTMLESGIEVSEGPKPNLSKEKE